MRIDRADSEAELLGPPISNREIVQVVAGDFEVRLAQTADEIAAAQHLRYRVFYEEMSAHPTPEMAAQRRDFDPFDEVCDHLLVLDRRRGAPLAARGNANEQRAEDHQCSDPRHDLPPGAAGAGGGAGGAPAATGCGRP